MQNTAFADHRFAREQVSDSVLRLRPRVRWVLARMTPNPATVTLEYRDSPLCGTARRHDILDRPAAAIAGGEHIGLLGREGPAAVKALAVRCRAGVPGAIER